MTVPTAAEAPGRVRILLAGGPALERDGDVVVPRGPKRQRATLVAVHLVLEHRRVVPSDELADVVWADEERPGSWAASLRRQVSDVRQWLDQVGLGAALTVAHSGYRLDLPAWASVDVDEALAALASPTRLDRDAALAVVESLRVPVLPGVDAPWLVARREQLRQARLVALERLAQLALDVGDTDGAVDAAEEAVQVDPLRESAYRLVMAAHRSSGRIGSALRAYERCRSVLAEELGTSPSSTTVAAYQALLLPLADDRSGAPGDAARGGPGGFADLALAMESVGSLTAIANLEGRLAAVEANPHPDPVERVELLIGIGQARWALSGATDQLRRVSLAAGEAALHLRSGEHFGAAAALASTTTGVGEQDQSTEDLCQRALEVFADEPRPRARALGLLSELRVGEPAVVLATEAVAIARAERDGALLLDMLLVLDQALSWSPDLPARLAVEAECATLLDARTRWRTRPTFEPLTRLQAGELDWYRAEAERMAAAGADGRQWEPRFYATAFRAIVAHLAGDLATGFRLADELMAMSRDELNAVHSAAGLYLALTRDSGGIANLLPLVEDLATKNPRVSSFGAAAVVGWALTGSPGRARDGLDVLLVDDGAALARDHIFPITLGLLAEAAGLTGHADAARTLGRLLAPYGGQLCAGAHACVVLGSVDGYRGLLAGTAGDDDGAIALFREALELERRLEAPLLEARTSAWCAAALARRGGPGDHVEAKGLADRAVELALPAGTANAVAAVLAAVGLD